ncbi:polysaccharide deacetylase family protein [Robbsia sp. Bb-Pol-6]|uniref:Polysaccharide deacetylase family protein n=1 Tax=Robbsia betulipollinis TaxID=2981849 RepID=A0ABT3ZM41_9BURK|nr:polysaccharide deacetylase family protein [Robbsia betulipollinis]MCY0387018.1 polysaccharide deacetylase family protein [Robbsia betulipollinis]
MSIPILMYHQIAPVPPRSQPLWTLNVDPARFRLQMRWMQRLGYRGCSVRELLPYLRGEKTGKVFGITFDDGFANVLNNAMPVLCDLGFTATCYFVAQRLGGHNDWDAHYGVAPTPLMQPRELSAWAALGGEVGSHTLDHCHLSRLPPGEAQRQIAESKQRLEDVCGTAVESFCYPYGDATAGVQGMVRAAGYSNGTMTHRGRARASDDLFDLPRVAVAGFTGTAKFLYKCLSGVEDRRRGT